MIHAFTHNLENLNVCLNIQLKAFITVHPNEYISLLYTTL